MNTDNLPADSQTRQAARFRFSLLALFVFVAAVCLILAWAARPRMCAVETLFQIKAVPPSIRGTASSPFNEREFDIFRHTQIELIKSDFVLRAALHNPGVASLSILSSARDPVAWLHDHVQVQFPNDSEILAIRIRCTEAATDDCTKILDSVAAAYQNEVVFADDQMRLVTRDALSRTVAKFERELELKMEDLDKSADATGRQSFDKKFKQLEVDSLIDIWRKLDADLTQLDIEAESPKRVMLIQPAVSVQE
jgi:hypothetical protein